MSLDPTARVPRLTALVPRARELEDKERTPVLAPAVGLWRGAPSPGTPIVPGMSIGALEILGVVHELVVPATVRGVVEREADPSDPSIRSWLALARRPVEYRQRLLTINTSVGVGAAAGDEADGEATSAAGDRLVFTAPSSGRFYLRPAPDRPPFVSVGDTITSGHVVGLLEVMKTFNRIPYSGAGLPSPAKVRALLVEDGEDIGAGDPLLELELP